MATAVTLIAPYEQAHEDAVQRLLINAGWAGPALPSAEVIARASKVGCAYVALVQESADPVGFVRIVSDGHVVSYVAEIVVEAGWRDRGIGKQLLETCAAKFPTARLDLLSSQLATGFYEAVGFEEKPGYRRWPG
jgi:ribosomal protein S18 acetylase RimI-like enzyme